MADAEDGEVGDVAAGNVGLNTAYSSGADAAAIVFYGQFGRRRSRQLIEACFEDGRLLPRRTLGALGAEIPELKRRFRFNDDFARATLPEILGADRLAAAERFEARAFRSGVFLSDGRGGWRFQPLPRICQIAPAQAMAAGDFDGDGRMDLFIVQNWHGPIPYVGRFTGGLGQLLLGDGQGGFRAVEPAESGLVVPGDGRDVAVVDFGRRWGRGLLVSRNDSTLLGFVRRPAEREAGR
ncbi:MAG: VCBS repeat-containing protein [Verrucomicrobia bacterium]|nr:MAG: VCBS repeat-containing protein [Verrucomicrobiota bacterium]